MLLFCWPCAADLLADISLMLWCFTTGGWSWSVACQFGVLTAHKAGSILLTSVLSLASWLVLVLVLVLGRAWCLRVLVADRQVVVGTLETGVYSPFYMSFDFTLPVLRRCGFGDVSKDAAVEFWDFLLLLVSGDFVEFFLNCAVFHGVLRLKTSF